LTSAGNGTATTSYAYDYANRLIAILYNNATTTQFGYDAFGQRVFQIIATTSTTTYPFKFFSIASTTKGTNNFATSTEYVFNGDTLVATVDQAFKNGSATGTAQTSYIHPDHLGSTNVITNASGTVISTKDYYPFGSARINSGTASLARGYIGQFSDQSNLSYLNARYYDPNRGQFLSEDPIFLQLGGPDAERLAKRSLQQILTDPQGLNSYSYAEDNPITIKDPSGLLSQKTQATLDAMVPLLGQLVNLLSQIVVQLGGGGSASTAMFARSTTLNPRPLNVTPANQGNYGSVIDKIERSKDFTNYVDDQIKKNGKNGALNVPANEPNVQQCSAFEISGSP
jgi:RHS repeat-associated protein